MATTRHGYPTRRADSYQSAWPEFGLSWDGILSGFALGSLLLACGLCILLISANAGFTAIAEAAEPTRVVLSDQCSRNCNVREAAKQRLAWGVREFKVIRGDAAKLMMSLRSSSAGAGQLTLREVDYDGRMGPELKTWIQHYGPDTHLQKEGALQSDLLITCHPELYDAPELLSKHVFPDACGEIEMEINFRRNAATGEVDNLLIVFPIVIAAR